MGSHFVCVSLVAILCIYDHIVVLEQKSIGLISLLDEVSNLPKASNLTFVTKLKQHLSANHCFKGERGGTFSVRHCAGEVSFACDHAC